MYDDNVQHILLVYNSFFFDALQATLFSLSLFMASSLVLEGRPYVLILEH